MGIGRIEMDGAIKQYVPYASLDSGKALEYVYIERFIRTETLLEKWIFTEDKPKPWNLNIRSHMYDASTGEYLGKVNEPSNNSQYEMRYIPISFNVIPYRYVNIGDPWPMLRESFSSDFFSGVGVYVNLLTGMFIFRHTKQVSECPLFTWYKTQEQYSNTKEDFKGSYPAFLFRAVLKKNENEDPMFLDTTTKKLADAESTIY